jgi:hypothetical protein
MELSRIQEELRQQGLDGWLFFDHHMRDPLAYRVLGLAPRVPTRRWYYLIPALGEPRGRGRAGREAALFELDRAGGMPAPDDGRA